MSVTKALQTKKPNGKNGKSKGKAKGVPVRKSDKRRPTLGLVVFALAVAVLSIAGGINVRQNVELFIAGEVASQDVTADQDILVEDRASTMAKRDQVAAMQPPIFDLSAEPVAMLKRRAESIFTLIEQPAPTPPEQEQLRWQVAELLNTEISAKTFAIWKGIKFQNQFNDNIRPWLAAQLQEGVLTDRRQLSAYRDGIIIRDLATSEEALRINTANLKDIPQVLNNLDAYLKKTLKMSLRTRKTVRQFVLPLLAPSLTLNREATQNRTKEAVASVDPVYYHIKKGEVIVRKGERVTIDEQRKLQTLYTRKTQTFFPLHALGIFITAMLLGGGLAFSRPGRRISHLRNKDLIYCALLLTLFTGAAKALTLVEGTGSIENAFIQHNIMSLLLPLPGALGLVAMAFGLRRCSVMALMLSFMCTVIMKGSIGLFLFMFLGSMWNVLLMKRAQSRSDIALSVFPLIAGLIAAWLGVALLENQSTNTIWIGTATVAANGILSMLIVFALNPIIEMLFHYTTRFRLMELMNLEQPLLQELMVNAPGTYHHSLIVSNMVEAGAKAVGANSLLCKVAALYHDIGKMHKPEYFIENQGRVRNPHDKLAPSMSTLIITSHVKKGVELAKQHRLGHEIEEIIGQHHGNSLVRFFYTKAKEAEENAREEDYQYPGPKPQTKEAAIVMLADAVEASSRVLGDPTPSRIKGHTNTIIKSIFAEGQLDESELTFQDLNKLSDCFQRILTGIFHRRIEYPEDRKPAAQPEQQAEQQTEQPAEKQSEQQPNQQTAQAKEQAPQQSGQEKSGNSDASKGAPSAKAQSGKSPQAGQADASENNAKKNTDNVSKQEPLSAHAQSDADAISAAKDTA